MKIGVAIGPNLGPNFVIGCRAGVCMSQISSPQFSKALDFDSSLITNVTSGHTCLWQHRSSCSFSVDSGIAAPHQATQ